MTLFLLVQIHDSGNGVLGLGIEDISQFLPSFQTDNRDFKAMVSFDCPEKAVTDELISESFVQEQNYLRLRSLTLRSLVAAVAITEDVTPKSKSASLSNGSSGGNDLGGSKAEHMTRVVEEMAGKIEEVAASCGDVDLGEAWMNPVQGPHRPKLHVYLTDRDAASRRNSFIWLKGDFRTRATHLMHFHLQLFLKRPAFPPFATLLKHCFVVGLSAPVHYDSS